MGRACVQRLVTWVEIKASPVEPTPFCRRESISVGISASYGVCTARADRLVRRRTGCVFGAVLSVRCYLDGPLSTIRSLRLKMRTAHLLWRQGAPSSVTAFVRKGTIDLGSSRHHVVSSAVDLARSRRQHERLETTWWLLLRGRSCLS